MAQAGGTWQVVHACQGSGRSFGSPGNSPSFLTGAFFAFLGAVSVTAATLSAAFRFGIVVSLLLSVSAAVSGVVVLEE